MRRVPAEVFPHEGRGVQRHIMEGAGYPAALHRVHDLVTPTIRDQQGEEVSVMGSVRVDVGTLYQPGRFEIRRSLVIPAPDADPHGIQGAAAFQLNSEKAGEWVREHEAAAQTDPG